MPWRPWAGQPVPTLTLVLLRGGRADGPAVVAAEEDDRDPEHAGKVEGCSRAARDRVRVAGGGEARWPSCAGKGGGRHFFAVKGAALAAAS